MKKKQGEGLRLYTDASIFEIIRKEHKGSMLLQIFPQHGSSVEFKLTKGRAKKIIGFLSQKFDLNFARDFEKHLKTQEERLQTIESKVRKVPCSIDQGKWCEEPFCKFCHYTFLAEKAKREWMEKISQERNNG